MGQDEIKRIFFENPSKTYHVREIARLLKISKTAVSYHINKLIKQEIVLVKKSVFKEYAANESSRKYRFYKMIYAMEKIEESGLIDRLEEETTPKSIMLFGSFAKAEFDCNSDIDIFIQSKEQSINMRDFEKKMHHKINLFFESDLKKLSNELFNNIANGIKLRGYLKVR